MGALRKGGDRCTFLWQKTDCVVAWVVNGGRRNFHLCAGSWLRSVGTEFVEASGGQFDSIDDQRGLIAIDEVDHDLALLEYLVARAGGHPFDDGGQSLSVATRGARPQSQDNEDEADGDPGAHDERLLVNSAFHRPILAHLGLRNTSPSVTG